MTFPTENTVATANDMASDGVAQVIVDSATSSHNGNSGTSYAEQEFTNMVNFNPFQNIASDMGASKNAAFLIGFAGSMLVNPRSAGVQSAKVAGLIATHVPTMSGNQLSQLAASLAKDGVLSPLTVTTLENGATYVLDGNNRLAAAIRAGISELPVVQVDLPWGGYKDISDLFNFYHN